MAFWNQRSFWKSEIASYLSSEPAQNRCRALCILVSHAFSTLITNWGREELLVGLVFGPVLSKLHSDGDPRSLTYHTLELKVLPWMSVFLSCHELVLYRVHVHGSVLSFFSFTDPMLSFLCCSWSSTLRQQQWQKHIIVILFLEWISIRSNLGTFLAKSVAGGTEARVWVWNSFSTSETSRFSRFAALSSERRF